MRSRCDGGCEWVRQIWCAREDSWGRGFWSVASAVALGIGILHTSQYSEATAGAGADPMGGGGGIMS